MLDTATKPRDRELALAPSERRAAEIASVAMALPSETVGNAPIAERLGVTEDWIVERTGVRHRHVAPAGQSLADLAADAARPALASAGIDARDLDLVLVATMSHEQLTPSAAALVADAIGAGGVGAIDVGAACTGFLSGLALGAAQIESSRADSVLVVGADVLTRLIDPHDRGTAALFGDGAGAAVLTAAPSGAGIGRVVLGSDGGRGDLVRCGREEGLIRMKGHDTFKHAVGRLVEATERVLDEEDLEIADIDLFVLSPGQHPDHPGGRRAPWASRREGRRLRRTDREHVRGLDPDRPLSRRRRGATRGR